MTPQPFQQIYGGDRKLTPKGRKAHIVTYDKSQLWDGEGMSLCGLLLLSSDRNWDPERTRVCAKCFHIERG